MPLMPRPLTPCCNCLIHDLMSLLPATARSKTCCCCCQIHDLVLLLPATCQIRGLLLPEPRTAAVACYCQIEGVADLRGMMKSGQKKQARVAAATAAVNHMPAKPTPKPAPKAAAPAPAPRGPPQQPPAKPPATPATHPSPQAAEKAAQLAAATAAAAKAKMSALVAQARQQIAGADWVDVNNKRGAEAASATQRPALPKPTPMPTPPSQALPARAKPAALQPPPQTPAQFPPLPRQQLQPAAPPAAPDPFLSSGLGAYAGLLGGGMVPRGSVTVRDFSSSELTDYSNAFDAAVEAAELQSVQGM